jgi:hypothetical protein
MSNQQIIIQNYNKNMSGLTIEEAKEHIKDLKSKMEEEIDYYKTEIQLALQDEEDAAHNKKWLDYQKYLNEWEQNAEEAENKRQLKINRCYGADSNYNFWENYDEREDYNSKSEEEASEDSYQYSDEDAEEDDMNIYILRQDAALLADADDNGEDSGEDSEEDDMNIYILRQDAALLADEEEIVDNVITYELLQSMFDYKNAEPQDCCISKSDEEEDSRLDQLQEKLERVDNVVYQLLGGLFNHEIQNQQLDFHLRTLLGKKYTNTDSDDAEFLEETKWPTTRQGYQNEEEIRLLKEQVNLLKQQVSKLEEQIGINL